MNIFRLCQENENIDFKCLMKIAGGSMEKPTSSTVQNLILFLENFWMNLFLIFIKVNAFAIQINYYIEM